MESQNSNILVEITPSLLSQITVLKEPSFSHFLPFISESKALSSVETVTLHLPKKISRRKQRKRRSKGKCTNLNTQQQEVVASQCSSASFSNVFDSLNSYCILTNTESVEQNDDGLCAKDEIVLDSASSNKLVYTRDRIDLSHSPPYSNPSPACFINSLSTCAINDANQSNLTPTDDPSEKQQCATDDIELFGHVGGKGERKEVVGNSTTDVAQPVLSEVYNDEMVTITLDDDGICGTNEPKKMQPIAISNSNVRNLNGMSNIQLPYQKSQEMYLNGSTLRHCKLCNFKFTVFSEFERHVNLAHRGMSYYCICGMFFKNKGKLEVHRWNVHGTLVDKTFSLTLAPPTAVSAGPRTSKVHKCKVCGLHLSAPSKLDRHMLSHEDSNARFICIFCHRRHSSSVNLKMHQMECREKQSDNKVKWFDCSICRRSFRSAAFLESHSKIHLEQKHRVQLSNSIIKE